MKLWDGAVAGLCLRCFRSGGRSWVFRYREGSGGRSAKLRTLRLGSYPAVGLDAARTAAKAHAAQVAQGADPAAMRQEKRRQEKSTLGVLLEIDGAYERSLQSRGIVSVGKVMSVLRRGLVKHMNADVASLTRRDFVEALDALNDRPGARHELRKRSRVLLEWCVNAGLVPSNVLAGMRMPPKSRSQRLEESARRRALGDDDIKAVWLAAERHGQYGHIVRLALLTAMRRSEIAHLRWTDVLADRIVVVPERAKTGTQHLVPLTSMMKAIIERQPRTTSPLVFPSSMKGKPLDGWSLWKRKLIADANIGHFTLHDCRRSTRTLMSRLGVAEADAEAAIGHIRGGLVSIYNHDQRWPGRVDAFEKVSDHVARLVGCAR